MIAATPGTSTTALLEGAPAGLTITARLVDGDETLATVVTVVAQLDGDLIALDAYTATFIAPDDLPVQIEWLQGGTVIGSEIIEAAVAVGGESSLIRVLRSTALSVTVTFDTNGVPTDPSPASALVTITRDDGTAIVTAQAATRTGVGRFTTSLTAAQNNQLDVLTFAWTSSLGTLYTVVEVVGGFLFTIAQARTIKPLDNTAAYSTQQIIDARTLAETALEDACATAFVPRYFRERLDGRGRTDLLLPRPRPLTVSAATVDGTAITTADLQLYADGRVYNQSGWSAGRRNVIVTGSHGHAYVPPRVSRACLLLAKRFLVDSPVSDRATSLTTEDGSTQFLVTAGVRHAVFDIPECNAIVAEYGYRDAEAVA